MDLQKSIFKMPISVYNCTYREASGPPRTLGMLMFFLKKINHFWPTIVRKFTILLRLLLNIHKSGFLQNHSTSMHKDKHCYFCFKKHKKTLSEHFLTSCCTERIREFILTKKHYAACIDGPQKSSEVL